jgi:hypothetical protein
MFDYTQLQPQKIWHKGMVSIFSFTFKTKKPKKLGVDIEKHSEDIKLIFYKRQAQSMIREGLDPEEVLHEVYKGILIRNKGKCPFDPDKSALSTYVVLVMDCVIMNIINKHRKERERYFVGVDDDVATSYDSSYEEDPSDKIFMNEIRLSFKEDHLKVFDAIMQGFKMSHIARMFGWEARKVSNIKKDIQKTIAIKLDRKDLLSC